MRAPKKDEATVKFVTENADRIASLREMQVKAQYKGERVPEFNALAESLFRDMIAAGANPMHGLSYVDRGQLVLETADHKSPRAIYAESH